MKKILEYLFLRVIEVFGLDGQYPRYFRNKNNVILVYTMGKVGSTAVYATLKENLPRTDIFQVHFLSSHWLKEVLPRENEYFHTNIALGERILNHIEKYSHKRIKIVTLVREPVEREISDLFENPAPAYSTNDLSTVGSDAILEKLRSDDFRYPDTWFESEFKSYTGKDIYSLPFNSEKGYVVHRFKEFDLLCIKLERLKDCYREAFGIFLNLKLAGLSAANETKDKSSFAKYKEIKQSFKLPMEKLNRIYNSPYARHFYTLREVDALKSKWKDS